MKMNNLRSLLAAFAAFFIAGSAVAQTTGTVTSRAFAIGKGAGQTGFTSLLCAATEVAIGQSAANPACHALSGDVTMTSGGVVAIGAGKVTNSMLAGSIAASKLVGTDIATVGTVTAGTWQATPVAVTYGGTGATTAANARTNLGVAIGTNVQAWDADLDCLAALSAGGIVARTGAGTCAARTVTAPAAGITVSNGDGVAGNPTLALANDLAALEGLSGTGIARRTGTDAWNVGAAVANSELATMANNTIKGNISGSTAAPSDLTATQVTAALNAMVGDSGSGGTKGLVPAPGAGDTAAGKYLKADGSWAVPPGGGGGSGTVTSVTCNGGTTTITTSGTCASREILTANRTYYVRTDGSDSNNGLSNTSGGAFLTIQKAWNTILTLDLAGTTVTIQLADGTYTAGLSISAPALGGTVILNGNASTPTNVVISTTICVSLSAPGSAITVQNMRLSGSTIGLLVSSPGAMITMGPGLSFAGSPTQSHINIRQGKVSSAGNNFTIASGGLGWLLVQQYGVFEAADLTITFSGTPAWTGEGINVPTGLVSLWNTTISGAATGKRYTASANGFINSFGAGTASTYFPGNSNGTTSTGGGQS